MGSTSAYDNSDCHRSGTTDEDSNSNTDRDTDDNGMPEYGESEYYASEGVASSRTLGGFLSNFMRRSGGKGRIPTSNDPAPPPAQMTPYPILGQTKRGGGEKDASGGRWGQTASSRTLGGFLSNFMRRSGGKGRIPTSNDPAPPPAQMTPYPILGQTKRGGGEKDASGGRWGQTMGVGAVDGRGMVELSLWRRLAWPVWMLTTFIERRRMKRERRRRRKEREERRKRKREKREAMMKRMGVGVGAGESAQGV
ncbi:hypothetical protein CVT24_011017 [Panaeolus cyanescens]|uniref:Uncharacterized protein n=1 Tax=Panaeolus cyanescens TaxID=181874 RepID=A0A409YV99_9AGAR|nr:hypothetical protein CVT24_011017 [Panaeolus cyanescens]